MRLERQGKEKGCLRLFVAIAFGERERQQLARGIALLQQCAGDAAVTRKDNLHLTLVFLGEVTQTRLDDVTAALRQINCRPFRLESDCAGVFPRQDGDICWIGIRYCEALNQLYEEVRKSLTDAGFSIEERAYRPHLTLGRQVHLQDEVLKEIEAAVGKVSVDVKSFVLMESKRINYKLVYKPIEIFPLPGELQPD